MPYGVTAAQGVLDAGTAAPRTGDTGKSPPSSFKVPGFRGGGGGGGSSSNNNNSNSNSNSKESHFRGDTRATSTTFTGVMQALLKPARGPAAAAGAGAGAKGESPERPQETFRPRSALDLSGHSFSKTMKAEINRSKLAKQTNGVRGGGGGRAGSIPRHDWWDRSGGLGMDDSLSRPPSARGASSHAAESSRSGPHRAPPRAPVAAGGGGSAVQHQQRRQQQQQQSMSMCRPKSHGDAIFDELSRWTGLQ